MIYHRLNKFINNKRYVKMKINKKLTMVQNNVTCHLFISKDFQEHFNLFLELLDKDPDFQAILKAKKEKDKRVKTHGETSLKLRYVITKYLQSKTKNESA